MARGGKWFRFVLRYERSHEYMIAELPTLLNWLALLVGYIGILLTLVYVVLVLPVAVAVVLFAVLYKPSVWLQDRYYDGADDITAAKQAGVWHYRLSSTLIRASRRVEVWMDWYVDVTAPVAKRLPLF